MTTTDDVEEVIRRMATDKSNDWSEEIEWLRAALTPDDIAPRTYDTERVAMEQRARDRTMDSLVGGRARAGLRPLTAYDTGERHEPKPWRDDSGKVDFDNDEGATELVLFVHPSPIEPEAVSLVVDAGPTHLRIFVGNELVWEGDAER